MNERVIVDGLIDELDKTIQKTLDVLFYLRYYTDKKGQTWIESCLVNKYETRQTCILYDASKPNQYYVNAILGQWWKR